MASAETNRATAKKITKVLLVDDHPMVRERLAEVINFEPDLKVCGEAEDRHQALKVIATARPDLAIIDLSLKNSHGIELILDVRIRYPQLAMLVVSMHDEPLHAERAMRAGASGYITKQEATRNILVAIRRVLAGKIYLSEKMSAQIAKKAVGYGRADEASMDRLTDRELRVFDLIGRGRSVRQIADELHLEVKTVETYRVRIREKLHLKDAKEVLQQAIGWRHTGGAH